MPAWYVQSDQGETGPYTDEQMRVRAAAGAFSGETQVRPETSARWVPLAETEFGGALPRAPQGELIGQLEALQRKIRTEQRYPSLDEEEKIIKEFRFRRKMYWRTILGATAVCVLAPFLLPFELLSMVMLLPLAAYAFLLLGGFMDCPRCHASILLRLGNFFENSPHFLRHCPKCGVRLQ
ncbi:MAG: DUF4339 domain-containing protein [Bdellovibrionota bacterium]